MIHLDKIAWYGPPNKNSITIESEHNQTWNIEWA